MLKSALASASLMSFCKKWEMINESSGQKKIHDYLFNDMRKGIDRNRLNPLWFSDSESTI
jgi:hypothetical protein